MDITLSNVFMVAGFLMAAYSIVANDAIQTLGTFLSSNSKRPWWVLWLFAVGILTVTVIYGWMTYNGDVSYGRLSSKFPVPETFHLYHILPPFFIVILTRFGIPVSTTFLVLTVFAPTVLEKMILKSLAGYGVAFTAAIVVYLIISKIIEKTFIDDKEKEIPGYWVVLQWCSTGLLWSQWLIQDLANIFVYMPTRQLSIGTVIVSLAVLYILHAVIFYRRGGEIQAIVTSKTNTADIRSATIVDFIYAIVLYIFKIKSNIPMSTTWVFLGLLAGRELAINFRLKNRELKETTGIVLRDAFKAFIGLAISVGLALSLPFLKKLGI